MSPRAVVIALAVCAAALLFRLWAFADHAAEAIRYPNELDYGEGIVWQHMRSIFAGQGYAPIDSFPTIVFEYPPIYYVLTGLTAQITGFDELATGRSVSVFCALLTALMAGLITERLARPSQTKAALVAGLGAGLMMLSCWPVVEWSSLMRVDMLALALSLGGLYLAMSALQRPRLIYLAAAAFVAALFTKQTMIAAPMAAFPVLLLVRPGLAVRGLAASLILGFLALGAGALATQGEFLRHLFLYNVNRFDLHSAVRMLSWMTSHHWVYAALALYGTWLVLTPVLAITRETSGASEFRRRLAENSAGAGALMAVGYLVTTQTIGFLAGKSGASFNYMIEWLIAVCILGGVALGRAAEAVFYTSANARPAWSKGLAILIPLAIAWQAFPTRLPELNKKVRTPAQHAEYELLSAMVRGAQRPVISDDMVLLLQNGKPVVWEPAIFSELAHTGLYDENRIIRLIHAQAFAFFVTDGDHGEKRFDERYNPAVIKAIEAEYPRKLKLAGHVARLPAEPGATP